MSAVPAYTGFPALQATSGAPLIVCEGCCGGVILEQAAVSALACQLDEGFTMAPRGGVEMGGLLIGTCSPNGHVVVDEIVPVSVEYKFGPSFRLSESDCNAVKQAVASTVTGSRGTLVGIYRSQCRGLLEVRPSDDEFRQLVEMAPAPTLPNLRAFLLLRRGSRIHFSATAHIYDGAAWASAPEVLIRHGATPAVIEPQQESVPPARPLRKLPAAASGIPDSTLTATPLAVARESASSRHPIRAATVYDDSAANNVPEDVLPAAIEPREESVPTLPVARSLAASVAAAPAASHSALTGAPSLATVPSAPRSLQIRRYVAGVAIAVAIGIGAGYSLFSPPKGLQPPPVDRTSNGRGSLGLAAVRQSTDWKLTWRRAPVFAMEPSGATLTIRDGGIEQQLGLALDELAIGSIVYTPHSGDVSFALEVMGAGRPSAKERIRVLDPGFARPAEQAVAAGVVQSATTGLPAQTAAPATKATAPHSYMAHSR